MNQIRVNYGEENSLVPPLCVGQLQLTAGVVVRNSCRKDLHCLDCSDFKVVVLKIVLEYD